MIKKVLLFGVENQEAVYRLKGCHNDVELWKNLLVNNFEFLCKGKYLDSNAGTALVKLEAYLKNLKDEEIGVVVFSGHGHHNISDNYEVLRFAGNSEISDYQLYKLLSDHLIVNAKLIFIFDTCYSGGMSKPFKKNRSFAQKALSQIMLFITKKNNKRSKYAVLESNNDYEVLEMAKQTFFKSSNPFVKNNVIFISAVIDKTSNAWEKDFGGKIHGVFSYYAHEVLKGGGDITYQGLEDRINKLIKDKEVDSNIKKQRIKVFASKENKKKRIFNY